MKGELGMAKYRKKLVIIEAMQLGWDTWDGICDFVRVRSGRVIRRQTRGQARWR